ncbi:hypothetical protein [Bradyrhizobium japonicum]|uniref:hypothetical protein n=1 Tax=Bradyrhizobium japonicum TaxID=375 RepID=UPI002714D30D|nr:hypothetical protein [Bradyrhizobium japonicum]WLB53896.1 hypothetical protein QIH94_42955 [Bradyrhizobium japonicum]WLB64231.1 hypothetical protein QIH96_02835 [Bradyrhizobium japonicum]
MLEKLMQWLSIAEGGFVGARDRTARQIEREKNLLDWTRSEARVLKATKQYGADRASFALALARRAYQDPQFEWAFEPAPRSYWRGSGASISAKVGYVLAVFCLWLIVVWPVSALLAGLIRVGAWLIDPLRPAVQCAIDTIYWVLCASIRGAIALIVLGFLWWLFLIALPALYAPWRHWLDDVYRELERPTQTQSSSRTYLLCWIFGVPLVLALLACALVFIIWPGTILSKAFTLKVLVVTGVLAIVALICVAVDRSDRAAKGSNADPHNDDVPRAQQVHPSIDFCEALLAEESVAHMVSLTDIRNPNGWSAWWIRLSLGIVTLFGRVFFTAGRLGDAPGIHFGHWHIIEDGRRYLFCSNYDGNFGGYLDDFINGATAGTSLAWRWTTLMPRRPAIFGDPEVKEPRSFPPTRFAIFRGVKCEMKFKSYARDSMLPHVYRFEASKATLDQIDLATALRDALFGERNDKNDDLIMRAIES